MSFMVIFTDPASDKSIKHDPIGFTRSKLWRRLLSVLALAFCAYSYAGNEDRRFEGARLAAAKEIKSILVERRFCISIAECGARNVLFVSPTAGGFAVLIHELKDEAIVREISLICARYFFANENIEKIYLAIIAGSKADEDRGGIFFNSKATYIFEYKRSK